MDNKYPYGGKYWMIELTDRIVYMHAHRSKVGAAGELYMLRPDREGHPKDEPNAVFSADRWRAVYAVSALDGSPIAVVHDDARAPSKPDWLQS